MDNRNAVDKNLQIKSFFYTNRENIILVLLIFFTVLSIIYKVYEINYNKLDILNINDKNKISMTKDNENNYNYVNNGQENNISESPNQNVGAPLFILGEKDGKIALYRGDKSETVQVYDVYVDTLPEYDKNELKAGIMIYDLKELDSLIEDFTS